MLVHLVLRDTLRFGTTVENEKIVSNVTVALPSQFSPLPVKVEHLVVFFWLLATPPKASQKTATAVKSLFPAIEALKYCEILPFQFGRVMLCPLQACFVPAPASAEAKPHKQGGWAKHISSLQKHTTPFPVKDSTKTHPLSIMATRIHTPHNEVHQSVIALPKAVQELLIRHLLEPWAWAARGCTWLWFFQIGCPKSPLVS